jgi:hypothetical protein
MCTHAQDLGLRGQHAVGWFENLVGRGRFYGTLFRYSVISEWFHYNIEDLHQLYCRG